MADERRSELLECLAELRREYRRIEREITELESALSEYFVPSDTQRRWIEMYQEGYSVADVAYRHGESAWRVGKTLLVAGVMRHHRSPPGSRKDRPSVEVAMDGGFTADYYRPSQGLSVNP